MSYRNNRGLTQAERQQECILSAMALATANFCIHCQRPTASKVLKSHPACTGYGCRACKTETAIPVATLSGGVLVRASFEGLASGERMVAA